MGKFGEGFTRVNLRFLLALFEEVLAGNVTQFHADDSVAAVMEPPHVMGLSAQGNEHGTGAIAGELWPVVMEVLIDGAFVEADFFLGPAFVPELMFHECSPFRQLEVSLSLT